MINKFIRISAAVAALLGGSEAKTNKNNVEMSYFRYETANRINPELKKMSRESQDAWLGQSDILGLFDGNLQTLKAEDKIDSGYFARQLSVDVQTRYGEIIENDDFSLNQLMTEALAMSKLKGESSYCVAVFNQANFKNLQTQCVGDVNIMILRPDGKGMDGEFE